MAKQVNLSSRTARLRLTARKEPYYQTLKAGTAIGYYRPTSGADGSWWGRARINGRYAVEALATADDRVAADGEVFLSWGQAQDRVRAWAARQTGEEPLTVAQAIESYLDDLRARKGERAHRAAKGRFAHHVPADLHARRVAELTDHDIRRWRNQLVPDVADLEQLRRRRDTANRVLNTLRAALNHAFKTGNKVASDHAWRRVEPFQAVGAARKVILDPIQLQLLVDACAPGLRELVIVGAQTGARLGELTNARVRDFDPEANTLRVEGKTGPREVYLAPATAMLLRRVAGYRAPDDLLLSPGDRPYWSKNLHTKRFAAAVRQAGLDPATCFYSLRHSHISHALKQLVPVKAVADHCGTSMAIIERNYAKFIVADRRRYAELAAPELSVDGDDPRVVQLREAGR